MNRIIAAITLICSVPQNGLYAASTDEQRALAKNLLSQVEQGDGENLIEHFAEVSDSFADPKNDEQTLREVRSFLKAFLLETNTKYGLSLTMPEVCSMIRNNMDAFSIPAADQPSFLYALDIVETGNYLRLKESHSYNPFQKVWDWLCGLFSSNKTEKSPTLQVQQKHKITGTEIALFAMVCAVAVVTICIAPSAAAGVTGAVGGAAVALFKN